MVARVAGLPAVATFALSNVARTSPSAPGEAGNYWLATSTGQVLTSGGARTYAAAKGSRLSGAVVSMAATPDAKGYWLVSSNGDVRTFGDAGYYGSPSGGRAGHVVGMAATPDGKGYWLVSAGGAVFAYGDARTARPLPASWQHP